MFKLLGLTIKVLIFSLIVLVLANWAQWRGRTISDQVKTQLAHAERSRLAGQVGEKVKGWAELASESAHAGVTGLRERAERKWNGQEAGAPAAASDEDEPAPERIPASEKQKLKALIRELNTGAR